MRQELERVLHDGPALQISALALELGLISQTVNDSRTRLRVNEARRAVCRTLDDMREIGQMVYPPVLMSAGMVPAVRGVAEQRRLALTLDVSPASLHQDSQARLCLLVADHLRSLPPDTSVSVRVRGRKLIRVFIAETHPDGAPRRHWAVLRCA